MLAACAARRWLARNAAEIKLLRNCCDARASECASLVASVPGLEIVALHFHSLIRDDLGCLLEALAWCPRLRALHLSVGCFEIGYDDDDLPWPFPHASAFAKLSSLTKLALAFEEDTPFTLADVVGALVPLPGLAELSLMPAVVPAALGHFKGLQSLAFHMFGPCVLEAGCLDLPNLLSLEFKGCEFDVDAEELPGLTALQRLTRMEMSGGQGPRFFDPQLVQLPGLQRLVLAQDRMDDDVASDAPGLLSLPADMGLLSLSLMHLDISGLRLPQFPLALTQLVALEGLHVGENGFAELPAGITALSRLKELKLGRITSNEDRLQRHESYPLDVRALGDLSGFPALRELTFDFCEVTLSNNMLGAVQHSSLTTICFCNAHPAPESALMVLQLSQALKGLGRGRVVSRMWEHLRIAAEDVQAPCQKFMTALQACGL